jgi:hypothetical protein
MITLFPENHTNHSDKQKNDDVAYHLGKILEILYDDQQEFKDKYQVSLYFNDALGRRKRKVKVAYQVADFERM